MASVALSAERDRRTENVFQKKEKNHHFLKSQKNHINLIKYIKIFEPCEKMKVLKLHQLKKKKKLKKKYWNAFFT